MRDSAAAAAAAATMAAVLVCCCCCCTRALPELQSAAITGDAVRLGETWRPTRSGGGVSVNAKAGATAKRTRRALDHAAASNVGAAGGGGLPSPLGHVRASSAAGQDAQVTDRIRVQQAVGSPARWTSAAAAALSARSRRSSGVGASAHDLRDAFLGVGGGGGWGPSVQDLRDTIIPRLRQLELTMDRATFLVLWHLISNNVHGSWEDAAARYGGGDSHATSATQNKRLCVRIGACLNGGKCYYETEDSKAWSCS